MRTFRLVLAASEETCEIIVCVYMRVCVRVCVSLDGGIARLRVYGVGQRNWETVSTHEDVDLVSLPNGGVCLGFSNAHFGHPRNMIGWSYSVIKNR